MREYELVYIGQPQLSNAEIENINSRIQKTIEKYNGNLFYAKSMGKKNLAYIIKKQTKGHYFLVCYAAEGNCTGEIERFLNIDENILRFLTVVKSKKVDVAARLAEIEARGEALSVDAETTIENDAVKTAAKIVEGAGKDNLEDDLNIDNKNIKEGEKTDETSKDIEKEEK